MGNTQTKLLDFSASKAAASVLTCTNTGLFWWQKAGAFLFLLYLNNFRVFGFLVPKGTKQFSASENVSLISNSFLQSKKLQKTEESFLFHSAFHASRKWLEAGAASGRCNSQRGPVPLMLVVGDVSDSTRGSCAVSQPVLQNSCPKRCFWELGSLNLLLSSLLKVQIITTRNVISSLLSFLSVMMYYNEHSGADHRKPLNISLCA